MVLPSIACGPQDWPKCEGGCKPIAKKKNFGFMVIMIPNCRLIERLSLGHVYLRRIIGKTCN